MLPPDETTFRSWLVAINHEWYVRHSQVYWLWRDYQRDLYQQTMKGKK